jgi:hypothetical protein
VINELVAEKIIDNYAVGGALKTGRTKDFARVKMFMEETNPAGELLRQLVQRFDLEAQWQKYQRLT